LRLGKDDFKSNDLIETYITKKQIAEKPIAATITEVARHE
jgi:hypothetical protein